MLTNKIIKKHLYLQSILAILNKLTSSKLNFPASSKTITEYIYDNCENFEIILIIDKIFSNSISFF